MRLHARSSGCIADGMTLADAKKLRMALTNTDSGHYFAAVRSGRNLPPDCQGPAAVFGGYALSEEEIEKAKGKS